MATTQIDGREIPVQPGPPTVVCFSDACNPADPAGPYEFWATQNELGLRVVGRYPAGGDPGERFRMMETAAGYESYWALARSAVLIRPASAQELLDWLNDPPHAGDAPCAGLCEVSGTRTHIVKLANGSYRFVNHVTGSSDA